MFRVYAYGMTASATLATGQAPEPKAEKSLIIGSLIKTRYHDTSGTKKFSNHTLELNFGVTPWLAVCKIIGKYIINTTHNANMLQHVELSNKEKSLSRSCKYTVLR